MNDPFANWTNGFELSRRQPSLPCRTSRQKTSIRRVVHADRSACDGERRDDRSRIVVRLRTLQIGGVLRVDGVVARVVRHDCLVRCGDATAGNTLSGPPVVVTADRRGALDGRPRAAEELHLVRGRARES